MAYALFAHCFTCSKDIFAASRIAAALAKHEIAVLRFDFTGLGSSEGEFASPDFSSNVGDLAAAADYLRRTREAPRILIGHSLGGVAVLAVAARIPEAVAVTTIGAPFDPAHVSHMFGDAVPEIEAKGEAEVSIAGRPFRVRKAFLEDIASQPMLEAIGNLRKALLIFHAPRDGTVAIEGAAEIFQAAKHPKSFVSLNDADHLLSRREDAAYVAEVLAAWAGRYLVDAGKVSEPEAVADDTVMVAENGLGRFSQDIRIAGHLLHADEPASYSGDDTGPSPIGFFRRLWGRVRR